MDSLEIISILIILAGVTVLQFFRGRKLNLQLVEFYMKATIASFKPVDRNFVWLGGYIGYRAYFDLEDGLKLEYTLTLLPRQSLLYFPISLLTNRHDKLYLVFRLRRLNGEAHLIRRGYYRLRPKIDDEVALRKEVVRIHDLEYELLYDKREYAELLVNFIEGFTKVGNVKHISLTPSTKVLYILMKPEIESIRNDLEYIYEFVRSNEGKFSL